MRHHQVLRMSLRDESDLTHGCVRGGANVFTRGAHPYDAVDLLTCSRPWHDFGPYTLAEFPAAIPQRRRGAQDGDQVLQVDQGFAQPPVQPAGGGERRPELEKDPLNQHLRQRPTSQTFMLAIVCWYAALSSMTCMRSSMTCL